jgi:3-demethylubiquinone-9 3-methyltransferase
MRAEVETTGPLFGVFLKAERSGIMATLQPITPCLWFDNQAEEAARYYTGSSRTRESEPSPGTPKLGARSTDKNRER